MNEIQKIEHHTPDLAAENINKLIQLFPEVATEVRDPQTGEVKLAVDFDALRDKLGDVAEGTRERYQFTWPGKHKAKIEAHTPITKTLRPVKERSKNWDTTKNLYIEGDNLDALKILRENYAGKIKLIYIDPPYNTGHDMIYKDSFSKSAVENQIDNGDYTSDGYRLFANLESNGRFHSDWCSMIYPRLLLARDMLTASGLIAISIDDNELDNLIYIMNSIYGETNRIGLIAVSKGTTTGQDSATIGSSIDYLLIYAKTRQNVNLHGLPLTERDIARFNLSDTRGKYSLLQFRKTGANDRRSDRPNLYYPLEAPDGSIVYPVGPSGYESCWRASKEQFEIWTANNYVVWKKDSEASYRPYIKYYLENRTKQISNYWNDIEGNKKASRTLSDLLGRKIFNNPKPVSLITKLLTIAGISDDDIIMDFFSGSATTAHAVMQFSLLNQVKPQFIMVQTNERTDINSTAYQSGYKTICEIGEERIRRSGDSIADNSNPTLLPLDSDNEQQIIPDTGFRVLQVDSSNYVNKRQQASGYTQEALKLDIDKEKANRSPLDLLFETLPTFQLTYSSSIEILNDRCFADYTVYSVNRGQLLACFDDNIPENLIRAIANRIPRPSYVVVAEKSLPDSAARTNFSEIFRQSANATYGQTQIRII